MDPLGPACAGWRLLRALFPARALRPTGTMFVVREKVAVSGTFPVAVLQILTLDYGSQSSFATVVPPPVLGHCCWRTVFATVLCSVVGAERLSVVAPSVALAVCSELYGTPPDPS